MRGDDEQQLDVFSYVSHEQRIPQDHPLRGVRVMADEALRDLKTRFGKLYAKTGRLRLLRRSCCAHCTAAVKTSHAFLYLPSLRLTQMRCSANAVSTATKRESR